MIIPIVFGAVILGRAFDMKTMLPTSKYIFDNKDVNETKLTIEKPYTRSEYRLVESSAAVSSFLDVSGELSIKAKSGDIDLRGHGSYLMDTINRDKTVELLLTVYHETVAETFPSYLKVREDWQSRPPSEVGTHYIRSIIYGGQLIISYQMTANSSEYMEEIKAAVNAHLEASGSIDANVAGKLEKVDKAVRGKSTTYIHAYATAGIFKQPQNLEDTFELIDKYPDLVNQISDGKGAPVKLELETLRTLNPAYEGQFKNEAVSEIMNDAIDKFDDLRNADSQYRAWLKEEEPPEELEKEVAEYERQMKLAKRAMAQAIAALDLSKPLDVNHFDEAFAKYAEGGFNMPNRFTRNLTRLMNIAHNITPRWYPYTRAITQYIHWGSVNCTLPSPEPLVIGLAATSPSGFGSGSNLQCIGIYPALEIISLNSETKTSSINGLTFHTPDGKSGPLFCAHCQLENATTVITVPARKECPLGLKLEYQGYLVTGTEAVSEPICVNSNPDDYYEGIDPQQDATANVLKPLWIKCDDCDEKENYIPCVVCSR